MRPALDMMGRMATATAPEAITAHAGERLRALRRDRGLNQTALAAAMVEQGHPTWTQVAVSYVETGRRSVSLGESLSLSTVFGVPPSVVVGEQAGAVAVQRLRGLNVAHRAAIGRARKAAKHAVVALMLAGMDEDDVALAMLTAGADGAEQAWAEWHALHDEARQVTDALGEASEPTSAR